MRITALAVLALTGCATTFTGNAKVERGRAGCEDVCKRWQMELVGMVQMGEYSDGCVCRVPGKELAVDEAAQQAATVAVETAKRNRDAAAGAGMSGAGMGAVR